jgi:hypothetical protein
MKKIFGFLVFAISLAYFSNYMVNKDYEKNKKYISEIFKNDVDINKKYGNIESYKLRKTGSYFGDSQENPYDYYNFYVKGSVRDGVVELKVYEKKDEMNGQYVVNYIK